MEFLKILTLIFVFLINILAEADQNIEYSVVACEHKLYQLNYCSVGTYIRILNVFYGRKDKFTCSQACKGDATCVAKRLSNTACSLPNALKIIEDICNGLNNCSFTLKGGINILDPCAGVFKYAIINYDCIKTVNPNSN